MKIKATFTKQTDDTFGGSSVCIVRDVVIKEYEMDWEDRQQVRRFASDSDCWLRRGPGYKVTTECVAYKPGEIVR